MGTAITGITVAMAANPATRAQTAAALPTDRSAPAGPVALRWLEPDTPHAGVGVTLGVPWPRGVLPRDAAFAAIADGGQPLALQSWPLAHWPDGSLKWSAHAIGPAIENVASLQLIPGVESETTPETPITVGETEDATEIDTGAIRCVIPRRGEGLFTTIERDGKTIARNGRLVGLRQDGPDEPDAPPPAREPFTGMIERTAVEQSGPVRAVVRIEGTHRTPSGRAWLPFVVRLYFYAGGDRVRLVHTFVYDGDESSDFIRGLGVRFGVPMRDATHDRHVRLAGEGDGLFAEGLRGLTGLRRDPGEEVRRAQVAGEATPPVETFAGSVRDWLDLIPAWGDYTLTQLSADGFQIRKRTKPGHGWIAAGAGRRASGVGYIGGIGGGVAFGLRDFWQRHPTQLDIRGANTDAAEVTVWLWSPEAPAMDLRFYHDGLGMDDHRKELEGLEITYEDYEKGFGTPHGVARTSELMLWACAATPPRRALADFAATVRTPPVLVCEPAHYLAAGVFGGLWGLPDRSTPERAKLEDSLDFLVEYYRNQVEQHRWYGFWDHGDVMHSYDRDRHAWRYDVGGYAWDNSELSPDLWLWYAFLRSGKAETFRLAEAMTRHTGEVDVYHLGRFKGLGTRHNVQHWGCSAKQHRISNAAYRRFYYFLTADERTGDLMRELVDSDRSFLTLDPIRKIRTEAYAPDPAALAVGFGTDWGSIASAWLTEYERTGDERCREKLLNGMRTIGRMPLGFFTRGGRYDLSTGRFQLDGEPSPGVSHLSAVFGLVELCAELIQNFDVPEFEKAWLDYCAWYNAPRDERAGALGFDQRTGGLTTAHSRLTAYAAARRGDTELAGRAWREFFSDLRWAPRRYENQTTRIDGPAVLNPIDEAPWVSTNDAAQWSLAAMQNLALIGDALAAADLPAQFTD